MGIFIILYRIDLANIKTIKNNKRKYADVRQKKTGNWIILNLKMKDVFILPKS